MTALPRVVEAQEDRAELVDEMLGHLLASFDYDLHALRTALHQPVGPASEEEGRPSVVVPLPYTPGPQGAGGDCLLNQIVAGGPSGPLALLAYLSEPTTSNGRGGKRTG